MASSLWKFIKSKVAHQDRSKINDLLAFHKGAQHGFPECPTALAFDAQLSLLAIATGLGAVHIYGAPGVELLYADENQAAVKHLLFIPNTGRLVALHEGGHVSLLEVNGKEDVSVLEKVKSLHSSKLENVTAAAIAATGSGFVLVAGNKDGEVLAWTLPLLEAVEGISLRESLTNLVDESISVEKKASPGSVVALTSNPNQPGLILIGFSTGIVALYDVDQKTLRHVVFHDQGLTNVSWMPSGGSFNAAFDDGGYLTWILTDHVVAPGGKPKGKPAYIYGPYPCLPLHKVLIQSGGPANDAPLVVVSGGLPKDRTLSERHSITMTQAERQTALDFPSPVVDFIVLEDGAVPSEPHTLVVLLENRVVLVDLTSDRHPELIPPHLIDLFSPITAFELYENVPADLLAQLENCKKPSDRRPFGGFTPKYSQRQWPFHGGASVNAADITQHDLLVTAHGSGCLRFWDASGLQLRLLHKVDAPTRYYHIETDLETHDDAFEVWPPFRKYGFEEEPVSDPRLQIQKFVFDPTTLRLAVAGKAGQVLVYRFSNEYAVTDFRTVKVGLVGEEYEYVWRGTQSLPHREGNLEAFAGFQGVLNVQLDPPSEITALALEPDWELLAVGTGHGFALIDYVRARQVLANTTLNPSEGAEAHETVQQKAKRAGDTLRRSLRRIPRPHLNIRSPTSYTFSGSNSENGVEKSKLAEDVELKGERAISSPSVEVVNGDDAVPAVNGEKHLEIITISSDKVITNGENGTESSEVKKETFEVVAAIPFEKSVQFSPTVIREPVAAPEVVNGAQLSSIIVDEAIMQSLEKDVMPPGLEGEETEKVEPAKPEKVYNYEQTTVRTLLFSTSFLTNELAKSSCLWAGLNNGKILVYTLEMPPADTRNEPIKAVLSKEIHLRHGAPVIFLGMLDHSSTKEAEKDLPVSTPSSPASASTSAAPEELSPPGSPLPSTPASKAVTNGHVGSVQKLIVASEEQLKIFHLPSLKAYGKYKLSNGRFKKVGFIQAGSAKEDLYLGALTTRGEVDVYSLPGLKRQLRAGLAKKDNLNLAWGRNGHGLYQSGTNELQRFFLTPGAAHSVPCLITLPEGARPLPVAAVIPETVVEQEKVETTEVVEKSEVQQVNGEPQPSTSPIVTASPTVEVVELAEGPTVVVEVQEDITVIPVLEQTENGQTVEEVVTIKHTVQTVTFSVDESGDMASGDAGGPKTLIFEETTVEVENLNDSMAGENLGDITSDSIVDYEKKTNGEGDELEAEQHVVHSLSDKLKDMGVDEHGHAVADETTATH